MLTQLRISNFAIIDELEINLKDSLIVLTGETGAGKSIILDALNFLLGSRASTDLIKTGSNKALVEGIFTVRALRATPLQKYLEKNGFETDDNIITISREITKDGSKARINGTLANVSHLLFIRESFLDIHQQSEHIELLKTEKQLAILDNFGDTEHKKITSDYKKIFFEYQALKNKLNNYLQNKEKIEKEIDYLKFQINEIKSANIKDINEEEKLNSKREFLLNKKELLENANLIYESINNENGISTNISFIKKLITKSYEHDESFEPYAETIENINQEIKDLSSFVNNYRENINQDENDLNEIEERLDLFCNLKRKYGKSLSDIQEYLYKIEDELTNVEAIHELPLQESFKTKEKEINDLATKLTKSREKITREFVDKINEELKTLGFKEVLFVIEFIDCELSPNGAEQIQFLFSANPDEPPKPLLKVISGGELSRVMLAIKSIACKGLINQTLTNQTPTMVFDEIDMGVSGEIAASVAKKLYKISRQNQVICITHQPIIASMADSHFVIEKKMKDGATQLIVREIKQDEKADALATLLTPDKKLKDGITEDARTFAKSLLENAEKIKEKEPSLI